MPASLALHFPVRWFLPALIAAGLLGALIFSAPATAAPKPPYKGFWGPAFVKGVSQFPTYKRLGVNLYQTRILWKTVVNGRPADATDPLDPAYEWPTSVDTIIEQATAHDMSVLIMVAATPEWANGGRSYEWAPTDPQDLADFVTAAAKRYPAVRHWMIWGEPSRAKNFQPLTPQVIGKPLTREMRVGPRKYARLLDASYGALKRVRRRNVIIGGNTFTAGDIRPVKWVKAMRLPNGKPPRMSFYGHNPFCLRAPDLSNPPGVDETVDFSDLGRFQKVVNRYLARPRDRKRVRLFLSEWTVPTGPDREFSFYTTPATQARFIRQGFRIARASRAYGLGWIHLRDEPENTTGAPRSQAGLLFADGTEKPGFAAFRAGRLTR